MYARSIRRSGICIAKKEFAVEKVEPIDQRSIAKVIAPLATESFNFGDFQATSAARKPIALKTIRSGTIEGK